MKRLLFAILTMLACAGTEHTPPQPVETRTRVEQFPTTVSNLVDKRETIQLSSGEERTRYLFIIGGLAALGRYGTEYHADYTDLYRQIVLLEQGETVNAFHTFDMEGPNHTDRYFFIFCDQDSVDMAYWVYDHLHDTVNNNVLDLEWVWLP